jgi:hypothetical protein
MIGSEVQTVLIGVFKDRPAARCFVQELQHAGFRDDQIGMATPESDGAPADAVEDTAVAGAISGGAAGGVAGLALGTLLLPGLGTVLAGGLLAAVLGGVAVGAGAGGVLGGLLGLGLSEEDAQAYEKHLRAGNTLVVVQAPGRYPEALTILERCDAAALPASSRAPEPRADERDKLT